MAAPQRSIRRSESETGEIFGRYKLSGLIASGGMATVHRARMICPGGVRRQVAIKRMLPHLSERDDIREMFVDEARIALRLGHPNLCAALDFGEVEDCPYLALEYLDGKPAGEVLDTMLESPGALDAPQWPAMAARIVAEACEGLHHAHTAVDDDGRALRVVHRDVSPGNVVVGYDGSVKVVDFGIARFADRLHETRCGAIKGKMEYMAPEQLLGRPVDARTDVFALGVTLWVLLTGRDPSDVMGSAVSLSSGPVPAPSTVRASVPRGLDAIVLRAVRRDPSARYGSAREMARDLHAWLRTQRVATETGDRAEWLARLFAGERHDRVELAATAYADPAEDERIDESGIHASRTRILRTDSTPPGGTVRPSSAPPPSGARTPSVPPPPLPPPAKVPSIPPPVLSTSIPPPVVAATPQKPPFALIVALAAAGIISLELLLAAIYLAAQ